MFNPEEYVRLAEEVIEIARSDASWETKYSLIFDNYFKPLDAMYSLDYYNPDTSHQEDVTAYAVALMDRVEEVKKAYHKRLNRGKFPF